MRNCESGLSCLVQVGHSTAADGPQEVIVDNEWPTILLVAESAHDIELHADGKSFSNRGRKALVTLGRGQSRFVCQPTTLPVVHVHLQRDVSKKLTPDLDLTAPGSAFIGADFALGRLAEAFASDLNAKVVDQLLLETYGASLLRRLFGSHERPSSFNGGLAAWQSRRATEYLREHLDEDVSLSTLAGLVNLSLFHFARAFKRSVGRPPHAYQSMLRVEEAKRLFTETDFSITDIALSVGYETPQTLARVFRRDLGMTPSTFRRERRR